MEHLSRFKDFITLFESHIGRQKPNLPFAEDSEEIWERIINAGYILGFLKRLDYDNPNIIRVAKELEKKYLSQPDRSNSKKIEIMDEFKIIIKTSGEELRPIFPSIGAGWFLILPNADSKEKYLFAARKSGEIKEEYTRSDKTTGIKTTAILDKTSYRIIERDEYGNLYGAPIYFIPKRKKTFGVFVNKKTGDDNLLLNNNKTPDWGKTSELLSLDDVLKTELKKILDLEKEKKITFE